jgi:RNA polymerase subunit RPABC4/transcription elongation factor Spt4
MKKKACKKCMIMVDGNECPICKGDNFATNWKGRMYLLDSKKSLIAKKVNAPVDGEYAIKV